MNGKKTRQWVVAAGLVLGLAHGAAAAAGGRDPWSGPRTQEGTWCFDSPASPPAPALTRGWQRISQEIAIDSDDPDTLASTNAGGVLRRGRQPGMATGATAVGHRLD